MTRWSDAEARRIQIVIHDVVLREFSHLQPEDLKDVESAAVCGWLGYRDKYPDITPRAALAWVNGAAYKYGFLIIKTLPPFHRWICLDDVADVPIDPLGSMFEKDEQPSNVIRIYRKDGQMNG